LRLTDDLRPCGFVSPRCHVQGSPFRGFVPPDGAAPGFPGRCPRAVRDAHLRFDPRQRTPRRLQGLAPRRECRAEKRWLTPARSAPLLGFTSSGCSLPAAWERFRVPSAHDLDRDDPTATGLQRFATARIGLPGCRLPTRSRFLTCCPLLLSKIRAEVSCSA
jgi:hypothetical protein